MIYDWPASIYLIATIASAYLGQDSCADACWYASCRPSPSTTRATGRRALRGLRGRRLITARNSTTPVRASRPGRFHHSVGIAMDRSIPLSVFDLATTIWPLRSTPQRFGQRVFGGAQIPPPLRVDLYCRGRACNASIDSCTPNIFAQMAATRQLPAGSSPGSWWLLLKLRGPEMLYKSGNFASDAGQPGIPYEEAMEKAHVSGRARAGNDATDLSEQILTDRPGFTTHTTR